MSNDTCSFVYLSRASQLRDYLDSFARTFPRFPRFLFYLVDLLWEEICRLIREDSRQNSKMPQTYHLLTFTGIRLQFLWLIYKPDSTSDSHIPTFFKTLLVGKFLHPSTLNALLWSACVPSCSVSVYNKILNKIQPYRLSIYDTFKVLKFGRTPV